MKKIMKICMLTAAIVLLLQVSCAAKEHAAVQKNLIRLHVVGSSDSSRDQKIKLRVKDSITQYLEPIMDNFHGKEEAMDYLRGHLEEIRMKADSTMKALGCGDSVKVSLGPETFDTRYYNTFQLPAGIYDALKVELGEAGGKNWWCVVFPTLCAPASEDAFTAEAVSAGFDRDLADTLTGKTEYRFFLMDCLGKLENFLRRI